MTWNKDKDIFALMVGHGTQTNGVWDSGCTYNGYTEADLMLAIVKVAVKMLRKSGVRVISDADNGNNRNMISSVAWANKVGAKYYVSVHCDYYKAPKGVAPLYVSKEGKKLATTLGKVIAEKMGMKFRGVFKRTDLYELNATKMTSCILETGAIKADLKYLKDYKKYGKALAKAICDFIGVKYISKTAGEKLCAKSEELLKKMNDMHFKYLNEYKKCGMSWDEAKKTKRSNCATEVSWSLQEIDVLDEGQIFWINGDKITCKGDGCRSKLSKATIEMHPHKKPKDAGLKVGDICGYDSPHTMIFAGWKDKKKTVPLWLSFTNADKGKPEPHVKKTYTNRKIDTILRLK